MKELKVQPIRNGTVIDHIAAGRAVSVLRILGLPRGGWTSTITAAMNVGSARGRKDILKIEDRELDPAEVNKISLIAPNATINIIREYEVARKERVQLPEKISGLVKCPNPNCVTNHEPVRSTFVIVTKDPILLRCAYCDREVADAADHIL
ncbi:MAG TPA: aspartate carbamoyltransferase regulatory subunit [Candidatus Thermoplasmatota archaeon]|nr:aspartate carbamoyltransferase regulatory subunit [Candidatus Thermoplasmatota archaeon]